MGGAGGRSYSGGAEGAGGGAGGAEELTLSSGLSLYGFGSPFVSGDCRERVPRPRRYGRLRSFIQETALKRGAHVGQAWPVSRGAVQRHNWPLAVRAGISTSRNGPVFAQKRENQYNSSWTCRVVRSRSSKRGWITRYRGSATGRKVASGGLAMRKPHGPGRQPSSCSYRIITALRPTAQPTASTFGGDNCPRVTRRPAIFRG